MLDCSLACAWNDQDCVKTCMLPYAGMESFTMFEAFLKPGYCGPTMCGGVCHFTGSDASAVWKGPAATNNCGAQTHLSPFYLAE